MTWMLGCSVDSNVTGSIGHQPVRSATPATSAMRPAFCGGTMLATAALWRPNSVTTVLVAGSTDVTLPPFDSETHSRMVGIKLLPGVLEQALLGERILGVEDDQLRLRLLGLEVIGDQARALVGARAGSGTDWRAPRSPPGRRPPWLRAGGAAAASARRPSRHAACARRRPRCSRAARPSADRCRAPAPGGRRGAACRSRASPRAPARRRRSRCRTTASRRRPRSCRSRTAGP